MRSSAGEESGRAELASKEEALINCAEEHSKHITAAAKLCAVMSLGCKTGINLILLPLLCM